MIEAVVIGADKCISKHTAEACKWLSLLGLLVLWWTMLNKTSGALILLGKVLTVYFEWRVALHVKKHADIVYALSREIYVSSVTLSEFGPCVAVINGKEFKFRRSALDNGQHESIMESRWVFDVHRELYRQEDTV